MKLVTPSSLTREQRISSHSKPAALPTARVPSDEAVLGWSPAAAGGLFLTLLFVIDYLRYPFRPGPDMPVPLGWWGWFDQSQYLQSARALAHLDLSPAHHHYPLGYALLGALFTRVMPEHPFFLVDLASLLIAYAAFMAFARRCGIKRHWSAGLFVLATALDPVLFDQWVIPWNTSPLAAIIWLLFAVAAAHIEGKRRPALLGLLAISVPMLRPTDLLIAAVPIIACLAADLIGRRLAPRDVGIFLLAVFLPAGAYAALHLAIYGPHLSDYMRQSRTMGFSLHDFGLKAYLIFVDPRAWIGGGEGLIRRCPWLILGAAGLLVALRRPVPAMLATALIVQAVLYLSYVDLLPTSFWRYHNVHYWTFTFPGFALISFLLLRDIFVPRARWWAAAALVIVLLLLCIHLAPVPARPDQPAEALDIPRAAHDFNTVYFGRLSVRDSRGTLQNIKDMRAFPFGDGVRILALKRSFHGPATVIGDGMDSVAPLRLRVSAGWGIPFWPWTLADAAYGARR